MDEDRIQSFKERAEKYFQLFLKSYYANNLSEMPYMHYLRNHVGDLMVLLKDYFGYGYGYFSCAAWEHLNKMIRVAWFFGGA